jgi:poly-gamma-glutamate synthesis protein (capsule biosynthesis protein)
MNFPPCKAITPKGRATLALLDFVFGLLAIFYGKKWKYTLKDFEEDPLYFTWKDSLYLGYKYYFREPDQIFLPIAIGNEFRRLNSTQGDCVLSNERNVILSSLESSKGVSKDNLVTVSLGGDLMPYELINKNTCKNLWDDFGEFFFSSDIVFANLETPIDKTKPVLLVPEVMLNDMHFNGDAEMFEIFNGNGKFKGYDVLSVANNHSLDQGKEGLHNTMKFLHDKNILTCGAAFSLEAINDFPILQRKGISFAFLAYTFSLNKFSCAEEPWLCNHLRLNKRGEDFSLIKKQTEIARSRGSEVVILSLHMGNAYQPLPDEHIVENVHRIARETKAEVIVCNHAHNIQPWEFYEWQNEKRETKNSLIFYALGDFVAYDIYVKAQQTLMVKLHFSRENEKVVMHQPTILSVKMEAEWEGKNRIKGLKFVKSDSKSTN